MDMPLMLRVGQGNPGALTVCMELVKAGHEETVRQMDALGVRGSHVWLAFKDVNRGNIAGLVASVETNTISAKLAELGYAVTP